MGHKEHGGWVTISQILQLETRLHRVCWGACHCSQLPLYHSALANWSSLSYRCRTSSLPMVDLTATVPLAQGGWVNPCQCQSKCSNRSLHAHCNAQARQGPRMTSESKWVGEPDKRRPNSLPKAKHQLNV